MNIQVLLYTLTSLSLFLRWCGGGERKRITIMTIIMIIITIIMIARFEKVQQHQRHRQPLPAAHKVNASSLLFYLFIYLFIFSLHVNVTCLNISIALPLSLSLSLSPLSLWVNCPTGSSSFVFPRSPKTQIPPLHNVPIGSSSLCRISSNTWWVFEIGTASAAAYYDSNWL